MSKNLPRTLLNELLGTRYQKYLSMLVIALLSIWGSCTVLQTEKTNSPGITCELVNIHDGDTMNLQCLGKLEKTKVRLYCIDAPEIKQSPWGVTSRDYLRTITKQKVNLVEVTTDRYGRVVGEVYSGGINLNMAQVQAGQAAVYSAYCKKPEYAPIEARAKGTGKGIWSTPGLQQTPWEWRKQDKRNRED